MHDDHILVRKAFVYNMARKLNALENCRYQNDRGFWIWEETNEPLVKSKHPNRPTPGTKKEDIETGEDLKGE
ncbi:MAG: hypothetical protein HY788_03695 [Deltaproteobacteria bacterium]|nr:hypothetical protein [Deltaproteobacteria bacterium]